MFGIRNKPLRPDRLHQNRTQPASPLVLFLHWLEEALTCYPLERACARCAKNSD